MTCFLAASSVSWDKAAASMLVHADLHDPILINTIGHTAGLLLFGLIVVLLIRDGRIRGVHQIKLSLFAAVLALIWNLGSLVALASTDANSFLIGIVVTVSFSVLSLLPAVLLQVALQREGRWIIAAGYTVSACAIVLHFMELFYPRLGVHQAALDVVVVGFTILIVAAFIPPHRHDMTRLPERSKFISLGCLLLFTSSFLHFGYQHANSAWAAEIVWHHLGIPVVLIVLLQDYRFLLLDTFTRFLMNSGLAAAYIAILFGLNRTFGLRHIAYSNTFLTGITLATLCVSLILFTYLRNAAQAWMSRVVFSAAKRR
jgi:two-component system, LytTR family, sensor kinase